MFRRREESILLIKMGLNLSEMDAKLGHRTKIQLENLKNQISREKFISNLLAFFLICLFQISILQTPQTRAQVSADQASHTISMLIKPTQKSACDGQQMELKCQDDYVIEIITIEQTILPEELHKFASKQTTVARQENSTQQQQHMLSCGQLEASQEELLAKKFSITSDDLISRVCNERQAHDESLDKQAKLFQLIRRQCSLLTSCLLDFSLNTTTSEQSQNESNHLGHLLAEECPLNRKLIELVYKCRPSKVKSRFACKNSRMALDCSEGRRLAVASAAYGYWPDDGERVHQRCSAAAAAASQQQQQQQHETGSKNCSASASPLAFVTGECLFKQQCRFDVRAELFNEGATCGSNQDQQARRPSAASEYLKVMFACVADNLLVPISTITNNVSLMATKYSKQQQVLLDSSEQQFVTVASGQNNQIDKARSTGVLLASTSTGPQRAGDDSFKDQQGRHLLMSVISADPQLSSLNPSQWSAGQRVKFILLRYQQQIIAFSLISLAFFVTLSLIVRACRRRGSSRSSSTSATSSSTASSSSSSSASSSGSGQVKFRAQLNNKQSLEGGKPLATVANHHATIQTSHYARQHMNSCSESCFSLDEHYNQNKISPGQQTPDLNCQSEQNNNKPRLWSSFYAAPESNFLQTRQTASTLRPARTFVGASGQPIQQPIVTLQQRQQQQQQSHHFCPQHQHDYLLAIQQQQNWNQQMMPPPPPQAVVTNEQNVGQQATSSSSVYFASLDPQELIQQQQQTSCSHHHHHHQAPAPSQMMQQQQQPGANLVDDVFH